MNKLKLGIHGAAGRLGRRILALALQDKRFELACALVRPGGVALGQDVGVLAGMAPAGMCAGADPAALLSCSVVVDVSSPAAAAALVQRLAGAARRPALITGVTGWTAEQDKVLLEASSHLALLRSGNFSLGVTALVRQVRDAAARLGPGWGVHIHDHHHAGKKDAPSGTALMLAGAVQEGWGGAGKPVILPAGQSPKHNPGPGEIIISSQRKGDVAGTHQVRFFGREEVLSFGHTAASRDIFARGALDAAHWLAGRKPGLYAMADVPGS